MAYLLQLYCQEDSLKCRLRNKLLIDDIHITITEGRRCVAEGKAKKWSQRQKCVGLGRGNVLFETVWPGSTMKYSCWCRLAYNLSSIFFTSAKCERYIIYVFCGKGQRESESSTCFPCKRNRIKWGHFGVNFLLPWRVCCRVRVSSRAVKVCQNKQITGKNSDKRQ